MATTINNLSVFLFALDTKGIFTLAQGQCFEMLGITPAEIVGYSAFKILAGVPTALAEFQRALAGESFRVARKIKERWLETTYTPVRDATGKIESVMGMVVDTTASKHAYEDLSYENKFTRTIINTMGQGLTVTNSEKIFEFVNPAYAKMLGFTPQELIGKSPVDVTDPEELRTGLSAWERRSSGETTTYETRLIKANGSKIHVLITGAPRMRDGKFMGTISVATDLTQQKEHEGMLKQVYEQALEASRLKSEFLTIMSHEIRTPLNSIIGMSELLADSVLDSEQYEFNAVIYEAAHMLLGMVNNILDFSKIEAGKLILDNTDFELAPLMEGVVKSLAPKAHQKNLSLTIFFSPEVPRYLWGDVVRLRRVLVNLIDNALKFTTKGEVTIRVTVEQPPAENKLPRVYFEIHDSGIGLSETVQRKLFQPFTQGDGSITRKYEGIGLGLAICQRLVELMGGEIGLRSVEGVGTTFWFTLPLKAGTLLSD
ncbi:MAG: PAS domain S-box protein [Chloroflexi bacterium]|nr:PAS domain S-box protein [Chloroflexota bacterium]